MLSKTADVLLVGSGGAAGQLRKSGHAPWPGYSWCVHLRLCFCEHGPVVPYLSISTACLAAADKRMPCCAVLSRPCLLPLLFVVLCVPAAADMVQRGCERNVITYSSLISACEKAGRCEMALQLFERMHKEGCIPNVVTYNSLIAACSHGETSTSCACQART